MKLKVILTGYIDCPDYWTNLDNLLPEEIADFHYNDKLNLNDALRDLTEKLQHYPDDVEFDFISILEE